MSIHPAIERIDRQYDDDTKIGEGLIRSRVQVYNVVLYPTAVNAGIEPADVITDERLPQYLQSYRDRFGVIYDPFCVMREVTIRRANNSRLILNLTYNFSSQPYLPISTDDRIGGGGHSPKSQGDPLQWAPKFNYEYKETQIAFRRAFANANGTTPVGAANPYVPVLNTAGDYFDPTPTVPMITRVITYRRYESVWRPTFWDNHNYKVNSKTWNQYKPGIVLCYPPVCQTWEAIGAGIYFPLEYKFEIINTDFFPDWKIYLDSFGYREKVGGILRRIQVPAGRDVTKPWPLKADGTANLTPDPAVDPVRTGFIRYLQYDLNDLNIKLPADGSDLQALSGY